MPKSDHSRWWLAAEGAIALALGTMPWALGGAPPWTLALLVAFASVALTTWLIGGAKHHRRFGWHPVMALPVVAIVACLFQLVPVPPALLSVVSPPMSELREFALVPLGLEQWRALSLDPPSTARACARLVALGSLLFVSIELGRLPAVRTRLLMLQALLGVLVAVVGFGHLLAGADSLFGLHRFTATLHLVTPFGNTNHLAAYLALSGTIALGLALDARSRDAALGWSIAAFVCGVGVFLSFSRGGIGSFVATWLLVGAAVLAKRGGGIRAVLPWVVIGATAVGAGLLAFDQLVTRAESVSTVERLHATKLELWPMFWTGVAKAWPLGLGAGAFELGFVRWQTAQADVTFTHPENIVLQSLSDWGLPLTVLAVIFGALLLRRTWLSVHDLQLERTALLAVVGVLLHDVFDFALELQALAVAATVTTGMVLGAAPSSERRRVGQRGAFWAAVPVTLAVATLSFGMPAHHQAEQQVVQTIRDRRPLEQLRERALRAIDRHPADWVLYSAMSSEVATRGDGRDAIAWVNRLLFLRPHHATAHLAAAQALLRLGNPSQALGELKEAWMLGDTQSVDLGIAVALKQGQLDRLLIDRPGHLRLVWGRLRARSLDEQARRLLDSVEFSAMGDEVRAEAAVLLVQHESELGDAARALEAWERLPEATRGDLDQSLVRVTLLTRLHRDDEAIALLERLVARYPSELRVALLLADNLAARGRPAAAREVLERSRPFFSGPQQRASLFEREAALLMQEARWGRALDALQTASRIEPTRPDLHYRMAQVYEQMGSPASALDAVRKGRTLDTPEGARAQDATVKRLESLIDGQVR